MLAPTLFKNEKTEIVDLVRKWGGSTTDALLDPSCKQFMIEGVLGFIGYREDAGCAVVFGDPISAPEDRSLLVEAFHLFCKSANLKIVYLIVSEEFARWVLNHGCQSMIEFGQELSLDPHADPRKREGVNGSLVRRKTRHAIKELVSVKEYVGEDRSIENEIIEVGADWLKSRKGPQIHFSDVHTFENRMGKRWFYAIKEREIVGVLTINRIERYQGWLMNHLMFKSNAPHGVPELLVVTALEALAKEECHYVCFGTVPNSRLGEVVGLSKLSEYLARGIYSLARGVFHLDGKSKFWGKFHPEIKRSFLVFSNDYVSLNEVVALKNALNVSFGSGKPDLYRK